MKRRKAFTMIEVIIVLVIFGIIAGIGADIISRMYMNYLQSRTINYLQTQSEITLEQIAKRLQYRVKDTAIAIRTDTGDIKLLNHPSVNEAYNVIEWIGYSNEAQLTQGTPGWSGFIDLDTSTNTSLSTPGSNLNAANNIIKTLTNNQINLEQSTHAAALIFKHKPAGFYDPQNDIGYGWKTPGTTDNNFILKVTGIGDKFTLNGSPKKIFEHYYLAHSAYAIVKEDALNSNDRDFDLVLKYNYQPWLSTHNNRTTGSSAILAKNVNLFRVKQIGNTIRIKLCLHDANKTGTGSYIVACKEEVIL